MGSLELSTGTIVPIIDGSVGVDSASGVENAYSLSRREL